MEGTMLGPISNSSTQQTQLSKTLLRNKNYAKKSLWATQIYNIHTFYLFGKYSLNYFTLYTMLISWSSKIRDQGLNFRSATS